MDVVVILEEDVAAALAGTLAELALGAEAADVRPEAAGRDGIGALGGMSARIFPC